MLLHIFKHVLQYLRAVRDHQPFAVAQCLTQDTLAAIALEASFYGLPDLEEATEDSMSTSICISTRTTWSMSTHVWRHHKLPSRLELLDLDPLHLHLEHLRLRLQHLCLELRLHLRLPLVSLLSPQCP